MYYIYHHKSIVSFQQRPWLPEFYQYDVSSMLSYYKPNQPTSICIKPLKCNICISIFERDHEQEINTASTELINILVTIIVTIEKTVLISDLTKNILS